jgi:hypothetical protein
MCEQCFPSTPPSTVLDYSLGMVAIVVDESHLIVSIRRCEACTQKYVWVTRGQIDWTAGQIRSILPLTDEEALIYRNQGDAIDLAALAKLAESRTFLELQSGHGGRYATGGFPRRA